jgi:hypothetical protein
MSGALSEHRAGWTSVQPLGEPGRQTLARAEHRMGADIFDANAGHELIGSGGGPGAWTLGRAE